LDKDSYECYFGYGNCAIWFKDACVGIALLHDEIYLLSLREKVHSVCNMNEKISLSNKKENKRKMNSRLIKVMALSIRPYFEGKNRKPR
jgi:hypothetical protein